MIITKNGVITHNDLKELDSFSQANANDYIYSLKEDLLQINFESKNTLLDVGWYPEFNSKGSFVIQVIKAFDWESPILKVKTKNLKEVYNIVNTLLKDLDEDKL